MVSGTCQKRELYGQFSPRCGPRSFQLYSGLVMIHTTFFFFFFYKAKKTPKVCTGAGRIGGGEGLSCVPVPLLPRAEVL